MSKSDFDAINERFTTDGQRQAAHAALERHYAEERERLEQGRAALEYDPETFAALVDYLVIREQPTQNAEGVHVGDLFYASWGYEQTNIDYFQVVALKGAHTAVLREIGCEYVGGFGFSGNKRPLRNHFTSEETYTVRTRKSRYYRDERVEIRAPHISSGHFLTATNDFEEHAYTSYA